MKILIKVLQWFSFAWFIFAGMLMLGGMIGIWLQDGFIGMLKMYGPFDLANSVIIALTFAPAVGAIKWADKLRAQSK